MLYRDQVQSNTTKIFDISLWEKTDKKEKRAKSRQEIIHRSFIHWTEDCKLDKVPRKYISTTEFLFFYFFWTKSLGWPNIVLLEGDALEVIQNVLKSEERWGSYGPIIQDAKTRLRNFTEWRMEHISGNSWKKKRKNIFYLLELFIHLHFYFKYL